MITTVCKISYGSQTVPPIVPAVQGDTGRAISFEIADFTPPAGATATYFILKPSGEAIYNSATITNNSILCELTAQSLAEAGENRMQVRVLHGEDIVTSFEVILMVRTFLGDDAIESGTEMDIFDQAVAQATEQFQENAEQIVEEVIESIPADYTELTEEVDELNERLGNVFSDDAKEALLACLENVGWKSGTGREYIDALESALYVVDYPRITASYNPVTHVVYDDDTLDSIKPYLTVTYYETSEDDGTVISSSNYTLSGILIAGTSTITVTYNTLQTTFKVAVLDHDFYWNYPDDKLTVLEAGLTRDDNYAYHAMFVDYTKQYTKATFGTSAQYGYAPFKLLTDHETDTALYPVPVPEGATKCHVKYVPDPEATTPTCQIILYRFESPTWRTRSYMPSSPTSDTEFDIDFSAEIAEDIGSGNEYVYALSIGASDSNDTRKQKYLSLSLAFS